MPISLRSFYAGPYRYLSVLFILAVAIGGYAVPAIGLLVPGLMVLALAMNHHRTRSFCATACPNGRALATTTRSWSLHRKLPEFMTNPGIRRALCGFMMFCLISLLARYGNGGIPAVGRIFWAIYVLASGIGFVVGLLSKPRSWCAFCPMGTLQDTIATTSRVRRSKA